MSLDDNKALVLRIYDDLFNRGRFSLAGELIAADFIAHVAPDGIPAGPDGMAWLITKLRAAFPDGRYVIEDLVAEDDKVAARITFSGTHCGPFLGITPTGRHVTQQQLHLIRIRDGKAVEQWAVRDDADLARQLGISPQPTR